MSANDSKIRQTLIAAGYLRPNGLDGFKPARSHKMRTGTDLVKKGGIKAKQQARAK